MVGDVAMMCCVRIGVGLAWRCNDLIRYTIFVWNFGMGYGMVAVGGVTILWPLDCIGGLAISNRLNLYNEQEERS